MEIISGQDKVRYHAAAAMVSNLYVGLANLCEEMLRNCGFSAANAHRALSPLMMGNTENIVKYRPVGALTGPIERNDLSTVMDHLDSLSGEARKIYQDLSVEVLKVAERNIRSGIILRWKGLLDHENDSFYLEKAKRE